MKDDVQALTDEQMSKVARDFSLACATVCLSGATIRSWLVRSWCANGRASTAATLSA